MDDPLRPFIGVLASIQPTFQPLSDRSKPRKIQKRKGPSLVDWPLFQKSIAISAEPKPWFPDRAILN